MPPSVAVGEGEVSGPCNDSNEEGWINPDNLAEVCAKMGGVEKEAAVGLSVGCVTTDFAMQVRLSPGNIVAFTKQSRQ